MLRSLVLLFTLIMLSANAGAQEKNDQNPSRDAAPAGGVDFSPKPLVQTEVPPVKVEELESLDGGWFIDFGKAAYGTVRFQATAVEPGQVVTVHLGETINKGGTRINRTPGGTIRYRAMQQPLKEGTHWYRVRITPDSKNTRTAGGAVLMPKAVGEVLPFRYCELEGYPGTVKPEVIRQIRVHYPFDEEASHFESSNQILNDIWELCKYSMKATSFTGLYIDGDRERIPYEADAYINQLGHYCVDTEYAMGRRTMEYFWDHATWPVEWHQHMSLMAWAEYLYTGDRSFVEKHYDRLVAKLLLPMAGPDGLLKAPVKRGVGAKTFDKAFLASIGMANNRSFRILVDWPTTERDGHVLKQVNSVVNAFHYNNLLLMSRIALDLGKNEDARRFEDEATRVAKAYQKAFFKEAEGIYRDGVGTDHSSTHANLFPLAFGLVPAEHQQSVADYVVSRGMSCSVYAAQYLMEALYRAGRANEAFDLLTSQEIRSWYNMIRVGSTITLEAWDNKFKPNQDWNHAWGAVPANIIPRYLLGVRPLEPGFGRVLVRPMPGPLQQAEATVPTPRGGIDLKINNEPGSPFELTLSIPANMTARVEIPLPAGQGELLMNGKNVKSTKRNGFAVIETVGSGTHHFRTTAVVKERVKRP